MSGIAPEYRGGPQNREAIRFHVLIPDPSAQHQGFLKERRRALVVLPSKFGVPHILKDGRGLEEISLPSDDRQCLPPQFLSSPKVVAFASDESHAVEDAGDDRLVSRPTGCRQAPLKKSVVALAASPWYCATHPREAR